MNLLKPSILLLLTSIFFNVSRAQEINFPEKPMTSVDIAALYVPGTIIKAAEQMPEEYYTFRPTPEVRSFEELIAHIAESNFERSAISKREESPVLKVIPTKTEALKALKKTFDYYAEARENMTKQRRETLTKFMGGSQPAGNALDFSVYHCLQHYIIGCMRLKGLVPPSSE